jgi:hypothetical protein
MQLVKPNQQVDAFLIDLLFTQSSQSRLNNASIAVLKMRSVRLDIIKTRFIGIRGIGANS